MTCHVTVSEYGDLSPLNQTNSAVLLYSCYFLEVWGIWDDKNFKTFNTKKKKNQDKVN